MWLGKGLFLTGTARMASTDVSPSINEDNLFLQTSDVALASFIELNPDELLFSTLEFDFDDDGYEDQINIIKSSESPFIKIIVALYKPKKSEYERACVIKTDVIQFKTFSCNNVDVIGDHRNALVYQGVDENDNFVLRIYRGGYNSSGTFELKTIGDFNSNGSVFIQQNPRDSNYELSMQKAPSFPVWVYSSDKKDSSSDVPADQIQKMYDWNESLGKYTLVKTERVVAKTLVAKELSKILDGTVPSFSKFLDGLWYKTLNTDEIRYIFFDYTNSEIIFQFGDSEEIYSWLKSNLKKNGIYFSAVNKSIENLQRRFDISLVNANEISIRIQDDVRMLIGETNQWDGTYKKVTNRKLEKTKVNFDCIDSLKAIEQWESPNGLTYRFFDNTYEVRGENVYDYGRYLKTEINGTALIQFRSESNAAYLNGSYIPRYYSVTEHSLSPNVNSGAVALQHIVIGPEGYYQDQSQPIVLKRNAVKQEKQTVNSSVSSELAADGAKQGPALNVMITPQFFSPDNDGEYDELYIQLKADTDKGIKSWSFSVNDPESKRQFWNVSGQESITERIVWNGRSSKGELVQSATDYPYVFKAVDSAGNESKAEGFIKVDVLVIREGTKLKMQVPSIIFRSDHADFKSNAEVQAEPNWDHKSKGLDQKTLDNNIRVLTRIADILKKFKDYSVTIEGNANNLTKSAAEEAEVQTLSEARAKFVRDWLIKEGVSASRLTAVGNGSRNPATLSVALEDRWKNRRVEFILQK